MPFCQIVCVGDARRGSLGVTTTSTQLSCRSCHRHFGLQHDITSRLNDGRRLTDPFHQLRREGDVLRGLRRALDESADPTIKVFSIHAVPPAPGTKNKGGNPVLRPCCVERMVVAVNPLILLGPSVKALQHENNHRNGAETTKNPLFAGVCVGDPSRIAPI
jgi:hypothetical protein